MCELRCKVQGAPISLSSLPFEHRCLQGHDGKGACLCRHDPDGMLQPDEACPVSVKPQMALTHTYIYISIYLYLYTSIYPSMYLHIYIHVYMYIYIYKYIYVHIYVCVYVHKQGTVTSSRGRCSCEAKSARERTPFRSVSINWKHASASRT